MTLRDKARDFVGWTAIALFIICTNVVVYDVKDWLDSAKCSVAIKNVQGDADKRVKFAQDRYDETAKLRDGTINDLREQNKTIIALMKGGREDNRKAIAVSKLAAQKAEQAVDASTQAAVTSKLTQRALQSATQPTALTPKPWVGGNNGH